MLYHLFDYLSANFDLPGSGLMRYLSFRSIMAVVLALLIVIFCGKSIIRALQRHQIGESIRDLGLHGQLEKKGTPTMGGLIILLAIIVPVLLFSRLDNIYTILMLVGTIWCGVLGFLDDYIKVFRHNKDGLKGKFKIIGQVGLGLIVGTVMCFSEDIVVREQIAYSTAPQVIVQEAEPVAPKAQPCEDSVKAAQPQVVIHDSKKVLAEEAQKVQEIKAQTDSVAPQPQIIVHDNGKVVADSTLKFHTQKDTIKIPQPKVVVHNSSDAIATSTQEIRISKEAIKTTKTTIPFVKNNEFDYSWLVNGNKLLSWILYVLIAIFIVTAVSNGANLTDGLDGLLTGVSIPIVGVLAILAYVSGHIIYADYLNIMYIPNSGELVVFGAAMLGALIGFLWYNSFPAQIFMGDTGSLSIGGIIAVFALCIRKELLLPLLCGVFLVEALSVVLQVSYYKYTKRKYGEGRRILKMSPLHHHYQKAGVFETKIMLRFTIISFILAALTIVTLKIR